MITAIILAKNEEENIEDCLRSVSFCDEKIVIDDNSTDRTVEIAKKYGANIYTHALDNDFAAQRNYGLSKATGEWVLFVDADERVTEPLSLEISGLKFEGSNIDGFYIKRRDIIWGRELKHGETGNIKFIRIAKRDSGKWEGKIHEKWVIKGRVSGFKNNLIHYPHQSIEEFLKEINYYTNLRAEELYKKGIKVNWFFIIFYPKVKFVINYFLKLGILDGMPGLVFAIIMSLHSFLVRGKLWILWHRK